MHFDTLLSGNYLVINCLDAMPGFKDELLQEAHALRLTPADFAAVSIHAWPAILRKIEGAFVKRFNSNTRFNWWWENFKGPQYRIFFEAAWAFDCLDHLVDAQQQVWLVACDTDRDPSKFWLFQGTVAAIQALLAEAGHFEYYLVSKKYEWLLCETDHDVLVGLGSVIPKMQALTILGTKVLEETPPVS